MAKGKWRADVLAAARMCDRWNAIVVRCQAELASAIEGQTEALVALCKAAARRPGGKP